LRSGLTHLQLAASLETLESDECFEPSFLANMVMVYNVLHACWGKKISDAITMYSGVSIAENNDWQQSKKE
jgi:hypothetical protein